MQKQVIPEGGVNSEVKGNAKKKGEKKKPPKAQKEQHPKKNAFMFVQLGLLAIIVAISMSGIINNEDGAPNYSYLFGVFIIAAGFDFVLYREWFINSNKKPQKEAKVKGKKSPAPGMDIPGKAPAAPMHDSPPPVQYTPAEPVLQEMPVIQTPGYISPMPVVAPVHQADHDSDDTMVLMDSDYRAACLEYYDNGMLAKIPLDRSSVLVGRMESQVDYVINNRKISKVHVEFIFDGGNYYVKDYNSANGTYINGSSQRLPGNVSYQIFNGDKIALANVELTLRY